MPNAEKIRREKLINEAEGYLDLILCLQDQWHLSDDLNYAMCEKALQSLQRLDIESGRTSHVEYLKGQCYRIQGRFDLAADSFEKSLEVDSENVQSLIGMAWCFKRQGALERAIDLLDVAFEVEPDNPIISFNLACYYSLGARIEECCRFLELAIELDESLLDLVESEADFEPVRHHPLFLVTISALA